MVFPCLLGVLARNSSKETWTICSLDLRSNTSHKISEELAVHGQGITDGLLPSDVGDPVQDEDEGIVVTGDSGASVVPWYELLLDSCAGREFSWSLGVVVMIGADNDEAETDKEALGCT